MPTSKLPARGRSARGVKGTTYRRGKVWAWQFTVKIAGRRRHVSRSGYRTEGDARRDLNVALARWGLGDERAAWRPSDAPELLADYLDEWLRLRAPGMKASTVEGYRMVIRSWIVPAPPLVDMRLRDIRPGNLLDLYDHLRIRGRACGRCETTGWMPGTGNRIRCHRCGGAGGRPLSPRSVQLTHAVLSAAFTHAVESGALAANPATQIPRDSRPKVERRELDIWKPDTLRRFLEAAAGDRLHPLWLFLVDSGCRRGEALGLRWTDVADDGTVRVARSRVLVAREVVETTPKSHRARTVHLSAGTMAALARWATQLKRDRLAAGDGYTESGYVFVDPAGAPLRPDEVSRAFKAAVRRAGLPAMKLHGLRHVSAVLDLAAGTSPKTVQERLGHHSAAFTLDVYGGVTDGMARAAADARGAALYGATGEGIR